MKTSLFLDGVDAFVDGGPATGERAKGNVLLASADRIAIDAVGIAALKTMGANDQIMTTEIFQHEQIARAVELGIGVSNIADIEVIAVDEKSTAGLEGCPHQTLIEFIITKQVVP